MKSLDSQHRQITVRMTPIAAAVTTAVGALPVAVSAQETAAGQLEEIVVTATRRAESVDGQCDDRGGVDERVIENAVGLVGRRC